MTVVFRVVKTKNYTMMSNQHLKDKRLTLKAKGLMSVMLSLRRTGIIRCGGCRQSAGRAWTRSAKPSRSWSVRAM